jgi:5-oxoprolinase (ATP-hydrolysing) subunit A
VTIDLNCDLGEGACHDAELLDMVTTANVCCGAHAGDAAMSLTTLKWAKDRGVRVGAHPGYADREQFGRRELLLSETQLFAECVQQVGGLMALARTCSMEMTHLKPHGALYHQACRNHDIARVIAAVASHFRLPLLGMPNSEMECACADQVEYIREGFADRRYRPDGSLVPRNEPSPFIHDAAEAADQVERLVSEHGVRSICVHGDNPQAVVFVRTLCQTLLARGHTFRPFA